MPIYPMLAEDGFGQRFLAELEQFVGGSWLVTDAPWYVRVRAWRPQTGAALVVHWINYLQDEEAWGARQEAGAANGHQSAATTTLRKPGT